MSSISSKSGERTPESPESPSHHHTPGGAAAAAAAGPSHHHCNHEQRSGRPSSHPLPPSPHTPSLTSSAGHQTRLHWQRLEEWRPGQPHIGGTRQRGQEGHRNEGFGNSEMVQCKERIWFHQQE
ncbi:hypothetical protein STEG23_020540 [Scotinomys teguina]